MTARLRHFLWLAVILGMLIPALHAEPANPAAAHPAVQVSPPPVPSMISPVETFRKLLAMNARDREFNLTNRPTEIHRRILAKLQEYEAMKPEDRELRLRLTEMRWYLLRFMELPPTARATQLAMLPEADRQSIGDRLQQWDRVQPDEQKEVLKYERTMEQFADANLATNAVKNNPATRPDTFQSLDAFLKLPPDQREKMFAGFQRFFQLTDDEKQKTLAVLPASQREQVSGTLQAMGRLPDNIRSQYVIALGKFSKMSEAERQEFMKNAAQWEALSPVERQAWRSLVNRVASQPPLPPGLATPPLPPRTPLQVNRPLPTNPMP